MSSFFMQKEIGMAKFKIHKSRDYTHMSNYHFRDKTLSLKAKGLLSLMLSLPDDWDYTLKGLTLINADGMDSVRSAVHELENNGYLKRERLRDSNGRLGGAEYSVFEFPQNKDSPTQEHTQEKHTKDLPTCENPTQVKHMQLNTNILNTNKLITKQSPSSPGKGTRDIPDEKYPECFERIWEAYPRKVEKLAAYQEYRNRRNNGFSEDELETAVKRYADECKCLGRSSRYVKHMATFLGANLPFEDFLADDYKPPEDKGKPKRKNSFDNFPQRDNSELFAALERQGG